MEANDSGYIICHLAQMILTELYSVSSWVSSSEEIFTFSLHKQSYEASKAYSSNTANAEPAVFKRPLLTTHDEDYIG